MLCFGGVKKCFLKLEESSNPIAIGSKVQKSFKFKVKSLKS